MRSPDTHNAISNNAFVKNLNRLNPNASTPNASNGAASSSLAQATTGYQPREEVFLAVYEGVFVKCGFEVLVSVRNAVRGTDLETLKNTVEQEFRILDEKEQMTRNALAKLEASFIRGFLEVGGKHEI